MMFSFPFSSFLMVWFGVFFGGGWCSCRLCECYTFQVYVSRHFNKPKQIFVSATLIKICNNALFVFGACLGVYLCTWNTESFILFLFLRSDHCLGENGLSTPAGNFVASQIRFTLCLPNNEVSSLLLSMELNRVTKKKKSSNTPEQNSKINIFYLFVSFPTLILFSSELQVVCAKAKSTSASLRGFCFKRCHNPPRLLKWHARLSLPFFFLYEIF